MNGHDGFYPRHFGDDDLDALRSLGNADGMMHLSNLGNGISNDGIAGQPAPMLGGQSLDDIVDQNNRNEKEMRRRSHPVPQYGPDAPRQDVDMRRLSMMEFSGGSPAGPLNAFQFDPAVPTNIDGLPPSIDGMMSAVEIGPQPRNSQADNGLAVNTQLGRQSSAYSSMVTPGSAYASPMQPSGPLDMDLNSPLVASNLGMSMDLGDAGFNTVLGNEGTPMEMFPAEQYASPGNLASPVHQSFAGPTPGPQPQDPGGGGGSGTASIASHSATPDLRRSDSNAQVDSSTSANLQGPMRTPSAGSQGQGHSGPSPSVQYGPDPPQPKQNFTVGPNGQRLPWTTPPGGFPSTMNNRPHMESQFKNAYSSTGFDMLGVLMRVATRPNPEINIGSVDLSCAFVVCDADSDDFPIVYCSENFERLTGYTKHMILGRNCRFLQSPDGKVEAGVPRKYVDDESVLYLKNTVIERREAQISLINYRRGGQPFMNLLTMIPIGWDSDTVKFFVGFQVDLVEQPNSVTNRNPDGSYTINYQRGLSMPRYVFSDPQPSSGIDMGQTVPRDDVSAVLSTFGSFSNSDSEISKRLWEKVLLENADDVIHVLSLKGLFHYVSPACRRVLEYDTSELIGTSISSVCHPSDIVPVTRELKDTSTGASVNVVYRIRRKHSGYMWFESHGCLHTEQGKGRKCIILVGRERPVYTLKKNDLSSQGAIGESELWTKMSTSGMFLYVSSNVRQLLDKQPDELVGTNIQNLMTQSKQEFSRILELARNGKKASAKHEILNKRGQVISAFTTIYPGDATEGQKPTFIVAQTKLMKPSRGGAHAPQRPSIYPKHDRDSGNSIHSAASAGSLVLPAGNSTPRSSFSGQYIATDGAATTYAGQNGLVLGHQDQSLASEENVFDELKTTRSSSWQYELRQMEKQNRLLAEEVQSLLAARKKRKRRKGAGQMQKDCANCHTRVTPEWRRGPSGNRDLCNSCGLRWAKQNGRVSPRTPSQHSVQSAQTDKASKASASPLHNSISQNPVHSAPADPAGAQKAVPSVNNQAPVSKSSPNQSSKDSHAAKVARMEVSASSGFAGGVPEKIDERPEPD